VNKYIQKAILNHAKEVDLSLVTISENDILALIEQAPQLSKISISDPHWLNYFSSFPNLTDLNLELVWSFTKDACESLGKLKNLCSLTIAGCELSSDFFHNLKKLIHLESISFDDCENVYDEDLACLQKLENLRSIRLDRASTTVEGIKILSSMKQLNAIELLFTDCSDIGLGYLQFLENLTELTLEGCSITDEGLKKIIGGKKLTKLKLSTFDLEISNATLKLIGSLTNLKELSVKGLSVYTNAGLYHLSSLTNLECLEIELSP
jgi:hypothetical protein